MLHTRSVRRGIVRGRDLPFVGVAVLAASLVAGGAPGVAKEFVERVMQGQYAQTIELLDPTMRQAFHEALAGELRSSLLDQFGAVRRIGDAWHEDVDYPAY